MKKNVISLALFAMGVLTVAMGVTALGDSNNTPVNAPMAITAVSVDHIRLAGLQLGLSPEGTEKLIQTSLNDKDEDERECKAQGCKWSGTSCNWSNCGD